MTTISVICPVYNDPRGVELTLESLTRQQVDFPHEILAVDNDSTDRTSRVLDKYEQRYNHIHALTERDVQSSYAARNTGLAHAEGDLLAFIDADMTVANGWLESIVASHNERDWDYAGCEMRMYADRETLTARYDMAMRGFPVKRYLHERNFVHTGCLTTTREVFDAVGDFDARMTSQGDHEFGKRVHEAGFDQHFIERTHVYHPARTGLRDWLGKQARIGRGAMELRRFHPERAETASPTTIRPWLPPHPGRFRERVGGGSLTETVAFYALDTASKYAQSVGALREMRQSA